MSSNLNTASDLDVDEGLRDLVCNEMQEKITAMNRLERYGFDQIVKKIAAGFEKYHVAGNEWDIACVFADVLQDFDVQSHGYDSSNENVEIAVGRIKARLCGKFRALRSKIETMVQELRVMEVPEEHIPLAFSYAWQEIRNSR